jgi:hypothetical protein
MKTSRKTVIPADLLAHQAAVPDAWRKGSKPGKEYPRECYKQAIDFLRWWSYEGLPPSDPTLVHGRAGGVEHAWIELPGDVVFDGVLQQFFDRSAFYRFSRALPGNFYSVTEAGQLVLLTGKYGPWTQEERAIAADAPSAL